MVASEESEKEREILPRNEPGNKKETGFRLRHVLSHASFKMIENEIFFLV